MTIKGPLIGWLLGCLSVGPASLGGLLLVAQGNGIVGGIDLTHLYLSQFLGPGIRKLVRMIFADQFTVGLTDGFFGCPRRNAKDLIGVIGHDLLR
jgi:hypothetical protein